MPKGDRELDAARDVLARWLTEQSPSAAPRWEAAELESWQHSRVDEWLVFAPPGPANRLYLVSGSSVFSYAPTELAPPDALAAARASVAVAPQPSPEASARARPGGRSTGTGRGRGGAGA